MKSKITLKDGSDMLIRHVCRDDGEAFQKFFGKLSESDIRNRFFSSKKALHPTYLKQLTHADQEREIGLVAVNRDDQTDLWASGRLFIDPIKRRAEYAAIVRTDRQGLGVGRIILEALIEHGRQRELSEVWGIVRRKNHAMLGLASRLGFETHHNPDDASTNIVTKKLTVESA